MKWIVFAGLLALIACGGETAVFQLATATPPPDPFVPPLTLPDLGAAPEIENDIWLNSDTPVTLASQQGKVVLLEFWTFG